MTDDQFRAFLSRRAKQEGSQDILAKKLRVSKQHLSNAICGRRPLGDKVLKRLGVKRVETVRYVKL